MVITDQFRLYIAAIYTTKQQSRSSNIFHLNPFAQPVFRQVGKWLNVTFTCIAAMPARVGCLHAALTLEGHLSVSMSVCLTSFRPPTSVQPREPARCRGTFLSAAGVKSVSAASKSHVRRLTSSSSSQCDSVEKQRRSRFILCPQPLIAPTQQAHSRFTCLRK